MLTQNLFRDRHLARAAIASCSITRFDSVYEIEPENSLISAELAAAAKKVVVLAKNPPQARLLSSQLQEVENVEVWETDFLRCEIQDRSYKVFANVTSSAPSEIIKKLLYAPLPPNDLFLLIQEDAANRHSGNPKETELSALVKPWFDVDVLNKFQKADFKPTPMMDIILLDFKARKKPLISPDLANIYRAFIRFSFESGKKGLNVGYMHVFTEEQWKRISKDLGVKLEVKPTDLVLNQWLRLFEYFTKFVPDPKRKPLLNKKVK